jgi:hypothetical protein
VAGRLRHPAGAAAGGLTAALRSILGTVCEYCLCSCTRVRRTGTRGTHWP